MNRVDYETIGKINESALTLSGAENELDALIESIGDAQIVLLGEGTHGTHEFYLTRARITSELIERKGFAAVAVEADWPDAYRVNKFVHAFDGGSSASESLHDFKRFPRWMWRNEDVLHFISWLRQHNDGLPDKKKVGFYGLDLYSLYASVQAVITYLDKADPLAAQKARMRYSCFEQYGPESESYGLAMTYVTEICRQEAIQVLLELRETGAQYLAQNGFLAGEELFYAEQNARLVIDAEEYYRSMFSGRVSTWNLRDQHMASTLDALIGHIGKFSDPKVVVWEHNSHLGDARATEVSRYGELNVGQLVRQRYGKEAYSVGFTTHTGTVTAASSWGGLTECKKVQPSLPGSYENLFHQAQVPSFYLLLRDNPALTILSHPHLERAIGVIYMPQTERQSHYFEASLPGQFDAVIHFDKSSAVIPLDPEAGWKGSEPLPETFGSGL